MYHTVNTTFIYSSLASGLLCAFSFLYPSFGVVAFFAFVPVLSLAKRLNAYQVYLLGSMTGLIAFSVANYWIYLFCFNLTKSVVQSGLLFFIYIVYCAQGISLFLLGSVVLWKHLPAPGYYCVVPLFGASVFHAFPYLFDFSLAATQVGFPDMLLPIGYTGHWGLTSLILLSNIVIATLTSAADGARVYTRFVQCGCLVAAFGFWFYLAAGLKPSEEVDTDGRARYTLAIFQSNDPPSIVPTISQQSYTLGYPKTIDQLYSLSDAGVSLVVWPEAGAKSVLSNRRVLDSYRHHAQYLRTDFLVQDSGKPKKDARKNVNRSIYITREGATQYYQKVKRVPFGEYIPAFVERLPFSTKVSSLFDAINKNIQPGMSKTVFDAGPLRILPFICYDILHTKFVLDSARTFASAELIVLQSNDAWFSSKYQSRMHNAFAILRAVESRRPLLHVNNRGPSYLIGAFGKVLARTEYGKEAMYLIQLQSSNPVALPLTFITRHPHWFLNLASLLSLAVFFGILLKYVTRLLNLPKCQARPIFDSPH